MKKYFSQTHVFTFVTILLLGTACNGQVKKDLAKEKVSDGHPKLIKTIGNPRYGNVQCGMQDKADNLWFGTTQNGLYKYDGKAFHQFLVADGLNSNNIYSLLEDKDGKIWIGTFEGLCLYDPSTLLRTGPSTLLRTGPSTLLRTGPSTLLRTGPWTSLSTGDKTFVTIQIPLRKNLPPNKSQLYRNSHWVFSIMQAKSGKLWFATINGVYIYDGNSFTPFIIDEATGGYASSNDNAEFILEDKAGNIWFGGRGKKGVYRYDGKSITNIELPELNTYRPDSVRIGHNWAWPQLQDKNGNIWFSNWGGAYRYDGKSFTSFTKKDGLSGGVTRIIEDKKGNLWFGGDAGVGLSRYDGKSFTRFTTKDGLLNNSIWSILEDKTGNLWVGTRETGLYLFDGKTFITYSEYKHQPVTD